jgi:hypothetical protein
MSCRRLRARRPEPPLRPRRDRGLRCRPGHRHRTTCATARGRPRPAAESRRPSELMVEVRAHRRRRATRRARSRSPPTATRAATKAERDSGNGSTWSGPRPHYQPPLYPAPPRRCGRAGRGRRRATRVTTEVVAPRGPSLEGPATSCSALLRKGPTNDRHPTRGKYCDRHESYVADDRAVGQRAAQWATCQAMCASGSGSSVRPGRSAGARDHRRAFGDSAKSVNVTSALPADETVAGCSVVGDFNGWQPGMHQLRRRSNGTRSASVTLPPGTRTRFRCLGNNGHWFNDPDVIEFDGPDSVLAV